MRPPLRLGEFAMPKYEIITLPETHLVGTTQSYSCSLSRSPSSAIRCAFSSGANF